MSRWVTQGDRVDEVADTIVSRWGLGSGRLQAKAFKAGAQNSVFRLLRDGAESGWLLRIDRDPLASTIPKEVVCAALLQSNGNCAINVPDRCLPQEHGLPLSFSVSADILGWGLDSVGRSNFRWTAQKCLNGPTVADCLAPQGFQAIGRAAARLHRHKFSSHVPELGRLSRQLTWKRWFTSVIAAFAEQAADDAQYSSQLKRFADLNPQPQSGTVLVHGDIHPANAIETGERVHLIDWDEASISNPERDLINMKYRTLPREDGSTMRNRVLYEHMVDGYLSEGGTIDAKSYYIHEIIYLFYSFHVPNLEKSILDSRANRIDALINMVGGATQWSDVIFDV